MKDGMYNLLLDKSMAPRLVENELYIYIVHVGVSVNLRVEKELRGKRQIHLISGRVWLISAYLDCDV